MSVTIGSKTYPTYATVADADNYLGADFNASTWRAAEATDKARALVGATRTLDRQNWLGDRDEDDQDLAWPRSGTGVDGVIDDEIPLDIINASIELANIILTGTDVANQTQFAATKRQKAGSVEIEYFRAFDDPARFPISVSELIAKYLGGRGGMGGVIATGTDGCSDFARSYRPTGSF